MDTALKDTFNSERDSIDLTLELITMTSGLTIGGLCNPYCY